MGSVRSAGPAIVVAAVAAAVLVLPMGIGGDAAIGAWLYVGFVIAAVTVVVERALGLVFHRLSMRPATFLIVRLIASGLGIVAGWWVVNNTMGGPV